jgi:hypothetical protein
MFFFFPKNLKIKDLFEIKQGKNITLEELNQKSNVLVLNINSINFESNTIEVDKLQSYKNFDDNFDDKYKLRNSDFLIQRTGGGYCKNFSLIDSNFEALNTKIIISHNFLFARPRTDFPQEYLSFYHFLLSIAIENLLKEKEKNPNQKNIKYITIKEVEELELPINLENTELNDITLKEFNDFNGLFYSALKDYNKSLVKLNEITSEFKKFKDKYKEEFEK